MSFFTDYKLKTFKGKFDLPYVTGIAVAVTSYILTGWLFYSNVQHFDHPTVRLGFATLLILITLSWAIPIFIMRIRLTKLESAQVEIKKLALEDPVTGLPNRGSFNQMLDQSTAYADRYQTKCAILLLDLDNFKNVNDTLGHSAGDELLKEVGARIHGSLRAHEVVSRIGGDEFAILLSPVNNHTEIAAVAQRIINIVRKPVDIDGVTLAPSTSIGISIFPNDAEDRVELFAHADIALYKAKDIEKGTYYFFDESMREEVEQSKKTQTSLRRALRDNELTAHYQPQIELSTGNIVGFETLIRWNHPEYGLVGPGQFIQLADDRGLAKHIGNFVIEKVLVDRLRFKNRFDQAPRLSFNISPSHFKNPGFLQSLKERLEPHDFNSGELIAEIKEDCVVGRGAERSHNILFEIHAAGVDVTLDNFGTGYASLKHLRDLSVSGIKIDKSFVDSLLSSQSSDAIVQSIIELANKLGLSVVAEGVETREQMMALQKFGCKIAQGYYFAHPASFEKSCELLESQSIRYSVDKEHKNYERIQAANF